MSTDNPEELRSQLDNTDDFATFIKGLQSLDGLPTEDCVADERTHSLLHEAEQYIERVKAVLDTSEELPDAVWHVMGSAYGYGDIGTALTLYLLGQNPTARLAIVTLVLAAEQRLQTA